MPFVVRLLFLVLAVPLLVAVNVFLYRRLVRDLTERRAARIAGAAVLGLMFLAVPLARFGFRGELPPAWLTLGVLLWWGVAIYTLLSLLAFELVRPFLLRPRAARDRVLLDGQAGALVLPAPAAAPEARGADTSGGAAVLEAPPAVESASRRRFLARAAAAGALGVGGSVSAWGARTAFEPPEITEVPVRLPNLPRALEGFTIVQLTDVHVGPVIQERFVRQLVDEANRLKPDLLVITGDLVDGSPEQLLPALAPLRELRARSGAFFCSGNHDHYSGWARWVGPLEGLGLTVLRNRRVSIGDAAASFDLLGVDDWLHGYDLDAAVAGRDPSRASVLLAHQPSNLEAVARRGIGLQISGHTHGGQIFPGGFIGKAFYGRNFTGLSRTGDTWQYTSRGCGFVGPPIRVGAPPEIARLILLPV